MEFCAVEPFGPQMDDLRVGRMTAEICSRLSDVRHFVHMAVSNRITRQAPKQDRTVYSAKTFMPWLVVDEQLSRPSSLAIVPGTKPIAKKGIHTAAQWNVFKQGWIDTCAAVRSNQ